MKVGDAANIADRIIPSSEWLLRAPEWVATGPPERGTVFAY